MSTIRAFFAVDIDEATRGRLAATLRDLEKAFPKGVTWVRPENLHVTLKFLGDIEPGDPVRLQALAAEALSGIEPFELEVAGLGTFGGRQPRVVWAGVEDRHGLIRYVYEQLEAALVKQGWPRDPKRYHPHITVGRVRRRIDGRALEEVLEQTKGRLYGKPPVRDIKLYQSTLTSAGSVYEVIGKTLLTGENAGL